MMNSENIIAKYKVMYIGGLREYPADPKFLKAQIVLNIFEDRLEFEPKNDFPGVVIPFENILDIFLSRRNLQGLEVLGLGLFSVATKVMNNINIKCTGKTGNIQNVVFEMISGGTIWGSVKKCNELLSFISVNHSHEQPIQKTSNSKGDFDSIIQSIEKLSHLRDQGILTENEFTSKKEDLLKKLS
jgi:hypothetical protein